MQAVNALLAYCVSDLDPSQPAAARQLHGLPLCMTASGVLTDLNGRAPRAFIVTAEQAALLSEHKQLLLAQQVRRCCTAVCLGRCG